MKYLRSQGKPKKPTLQALNSILKRKRVRWIISNLQKPEPRIPPGEDEHSFKRNQKMLLSEEKKLNPNIQTIAVLMERTFAFRRREIMNSLLPIKEVLQRYPSLRKFEQVT